jgi:GDP-L-fucose synthase|tara:strand:+ start:279 stop:1184 length:906 start_codon:yes stop_codon:yes gene_type:complete
MFDNVLVTGGSGFLGKRLSIHKPEWTYASSKDCNLEDAKDVMSYLSEIKPTAIVHLAARVGGIKDNAENQASFYIQNTLINTNIIHCAHLLGIPRVLSSLSTCAFPDVVESYPFTEEQIFDGPPAKTNFSYGYTKRSLHVQTLSYRKQYGLNYSTFCPSNIYGPEDHFNTDKSHFVPALISKLVKAEDGGEVELWGTGNPRRQQLYVDDLAGIIPTLLERHNSEIPLIIAPSENFSIREMAEIANNKIEKNIKISYNGNLDGQYRKDGSNKRFLELVGDYEFTSFEVGIEKTIQWYLENRK